MTRQLFAVLLLLLPGFLPAQVDTASVLYKTLQSNDSLLFNVGFNTCDISQFDHLLSDHFEFFHDKDSICYKKEFIYKLRKGLCRSPDTYQSRRELVNGSTDIYPLYKNDVLYGAVQQGTHRFYETVADKKEAFASTAKFTHIWLLENGSWKLARSFSYDHQGVQAVVNEPSIFDNEQAIEKWLKENKVPALGIGIIKNGKLQQVKMSGELRTGETASCNTVFNVASLTKPITAMVTLKLISIGQTPILQQTQGASCLQQGLY
jgi:hypothetical protein